MVIPLVYLNNKKICRNRNYQLIVSIKVAVVIIQFAVTCYKYMNSLFLLCLYFLLSSFVLLGHVLFLSISSVISTSLTLLVFIISGAIINFSISTLLLFIFLYSSAFVGFSLPSGFPYSLGKMYWFGFVFVFYLNPSHLSDGLLALFVGSLLISN